MSLTPEQRAEVLDLIAGHPGEPELLTADQLATRLGVHVETIYRRTQDGTIPHLDTGFGYRYDWTELHRAWRSGTVTPLAPHKRRRAS